MRRGLGVAYAQRNLEKQKQLRELGETIEAERIGSVSNQLEALTLQLQELAAQHKERVKVDPLLRARFRQLADALGGADILSSRENVFSKQSGLDDFYYALAAEVVQICIAEGRFTGPYVPMRNVLATLRRMRGSAATTEITEDDVEAALGRLSIFGGEYTTVQLGGETYINTESSGKSSGDTTASDAETIMRSVGALFQAKRRILDGTAAREEEERKRALAGHKLGIANYTSNASKGTAVTPSSSLGSSSPPTPQSITNLNDVAPLLLRPCLGLAEIRDALPPNLAQDRAIRRVEAALQMLIKSGQVWVDVDPTKAKTPNSLVEGMSEAADPSTVPKEAPQSSHLREKTEEEYTYTSSGTMTVGGVHVGRASATHLSLGVREDKESGFSVISRHPSPQKKKKKKISSSDAMEHPAVTYWFVAFLH